MNHKSLFQSIIAGALLAALLVQAPGMPAQASPVGTQPVEAAETTALLQYTAGGHILGFAPGKVYLAGLDHALTVEFTGGQGIAPLGSSPQVAPQTGNPPALGSVGYQGEWPGVDVIYMATQTGLAESSYLLHPGARVEDIRLKYNTPAQIMADGSLQFAFETGFMTESAPVAFQDIDGRRQPVAVSFTLKKSIVGFDLGPYNPDYTLTIDPDYVWHAFYGSSGYDYGYAITSDNDGNIYTAGYSDAGWNGPGPTSPKHAHTTGTNFDITVVKLNSAGVYQWHTFYGAASSVDYGYGIASDDSGNVYISGTSEGSWTGPSSQAPLNAHASGIDVVVIKLNSEGAYQWHTFYGSGCDDDIPGNIASDGDGNVVVTGQSCSFNGPEDRLPLNEYAGNYDIMVVKLDSAGAYQWHTFYGSSTMWDYGRSISFDGDGNVIVGGDSDDPWIGPESNAPLHTHSSGSNNDFVVIKLNSAGAYQWHTFYGAGGDELAYAVTSDASGNILLTGSSTATWNGPGSVAPLNTYTGGIDIAVLKLNSAGAYQWHTFFGSSSADGGTAIVSDADGNAYVSGWSYSWIGPEDTAPLNAYAGNRDIVAIKLNAEGAYQWHTYYGGGTEYDYGRGITSDDSGCLYIAGYSVGSWNGPGSIAPLDAFSGSVADIMVMKLDVTPPSVVSSTLADPNPTGAFTVHFTVTFSKSVTGVDIDDFTLTPGGVTGASVAAVSGSGTVYSVTVITGSGAGTLRLDVLDDDSILDGAGHPLGGTGADNGTFTGGEAYDILYRWVLLPLIIRE